MKKEVEILVEVFEKKAEVIKKLKEYNFLEVQNVLDVYLYDPIAEDLKPDSSGHLRKCLRLRKKNNKSYIAYKIDHFDESGVWLYSDESETGVEDFNELLKIFGLLGYKELVRIKNKKSVFVSDKYEIVVEEVENLGLFMEVERLNVLANEDVLEVRKEIWDWIQYLGIDVSLELTMGKPELMLKKAKSNL